MLVVTGFIELPDLLITWMSLYALPALIGSLKIIVIDLLAGIM